MSCIQALKGIGTFCKNNLAGIKKVYVIEADDVTALSLAQEGEGSSARDINVINGITLAESKKFVPYSFAKQTGSLSSEITIDEANGVRYYTNSVTLQFNRMEAAKHLEIEALAAGQLNMIVEDNNGKYWYVGYDGYLSANAVAAQTGQSYGDLNGYTTTMAAMSAYLPFEVAFGDTFTLASIVDDTKVIK